MDTTISTADAVVLQSTAAREGAAESNRPTQSGVEVVHRVPPLAQTCDPPGVGRHLDEERVYAVGCKFPGAREPAVPAKGCLHEIHGAIVALES